jgi:hypothetical protein
MKNKSQDNIISCPLNLGKTGENVDILKLNKKIFLGSNDSKNEEQDNAN